MCAVCRLRYRSVLRGTLEALRNCVQIGLPLDDDSQQIDRQTGGGVMRPSGPAAHRAVGYVEIAG